MSASAAQRWQKVALKLATALPLDRWDPTVRELAAGAGQRRWIVALSGGADSVCLLLLLWAHFPSHRDRLVAAHFDHRLRGRASTEDARFCARLAAALGVACETGQWHDAPADPNEAEARAARRDFLEGVRRRHRAHWVWTGHHADDVAETLLMRLARGSGTAGLAAPRPVQATGQGNTVLRLRPLLLLRAAEIRAALQATGVRWREDASNASARFQRNRMRAEVMPAWEQAAGRDAVAGAALSRRLLDEDAAALDAWLAELAPLGADGRLSLRALAGKPVALWRRALHAWLAQQGDVGDLSRQGFVNLLALARRGHACRFSLGKSGYVRIRRGWLFFEQL